MKKTGQNMSSFKKTLNLSNQFRLIHHAFKRKFLNRSQNGYKKTMDTVLICRD